jgi:hypothetical protein
MYLFQFIFMSCQQFCSIAQLLAFVFYFTDIKYYVNNECKGGLIYFGR